MPKRTPDYDNVFKTMKSKHKRLFVSVINEIFGKNYPLDVLVETLPSEGYLTDSETVDGSKLIEEQISDFLINSNFAHRFCLCTLKIQYLAVIQLSKFRCYAV